MNKAQEWSTVILLSHNTKFTAFICPFFTCPYQISTAYTSALITISVFVKHCSSDIVLQREGAWTGGITLRILNPNMNKDD
jgi:hypothetical protein